MLAVVLSICVLAAAADSLPDLEARGAALKSRGDAAGALEAYEKAAALNPESARLEDEVGFLLAVLQRRDEALRKFQQAIDLDPKFAPAQYHLGVAYWLANDPARSIPHLQSAVALDAGSFDYRLRLGEALNGTGHSEEALPHLRAAVALDPKRADAWNSLGAVLEKTDDLAGALKELRTRGATGEIVPTDTLDTTKVAPFVFTPIAEKVMASEVRRPRRVA